MESKLNTLALLDDSIWYNNFLFYYFLSCGILFNGCAGIFQRKNTCATAVIFVNCYSIINYSTRNTKNSRGFFPVNQTGILFLITHELLVGLMYGLIGRIFIFALESLMTTFSLTIGLSNIFETGIFDIESSPVLSTLIILISIQLILVTDLHHMLIRGIDHSFTIAPISENLDLSGLIQEITLILSQSYLLALRITSPFIFFAIIVNLSFAFLARLAPHVQIYFVTGPIVIFSGMYFFHLVSADFLAAFIGSFRNIFSGG